MTHPLRPCILPSPGDVRTCNRWACLQRIPALGPDPGALFHLLDGVVQTIAAAMVRDVEIDAQAKPMPEYTNAFLTALRAGIACLAGYEYSSALLAAVETRGLRCLSRLIHRILPRLRTDEQLLLVNQPVVWAIPDGTGGTLEIPGHLARVGQDRRSKEIRLYDWRIEDHNSIDWMAYIRHQRIGVAWGWLQERYPHHDLGYVQFFLASNVRCDSRLSAEEIRSLQCVLQAQAMQAHERHTPRPLLGYPPKAMGQN